MSEDLADRIEALDVVEVTQADREAAADVWRDYIARIGEVMAEKAIRKGISDDTIIVQAFARHRITALRLAETSAALPDDVAGLVEWLEAQIVTDSHQTEKGYSEADKFAAITDYDWTPAVNSWRYHGDQAAERLARWKALLDIIRDRDEWRTQHENLLSVRQSDLEALTALSQRIAELEAENARLHKLVQPEWFYLAGDMSSDCCRFSVQEVIDEDWLWNNRAEGTAVVQIETAVRCPDIWALVRFFTTEEKDARQSDDDYEITEYASEEAASAALKGGTDA